MNKSELAKAIADQSTYNVSNGCVEDILNTAMKVIKEEVAAGNDVQLIGFGTFTSAKRAEREGKNPQTQQPMVIPACKVPKFRPGKAFKDAVNK